MTTHPLLPTPKENETKQKKNQVLSDKHRILLLLGFYREVTLTCVRGGGPAGRLGCGILEEGKFQAPPSHPVTYARLAIASLFAFHPESAIGTV